MFLSQYLKEDFSKEYIINQSWILSKLPIIKGDYIHHDRTTKRNSSNKKQPIKEISYQEIYQLKDTFDQISS